MDWEFAACSTTVFLATFNSPFWIMIEVYGGTPTYKTEKGYGGHTLLHLSMVVR